MVLFLRNGEERDITGLQLSEIGSRSPVFDPCAIILINCYVELLRGQISHFNLDAVHV